MQGNITYSQMAELYKIKSDRKFTSSMVDAIMNPESWVENERDADYWLLKTDGTLVWDKSKDLNAEYYNEWGNLNIAKVVEADEDATFAETLAEYVGEERAAQILGANYKNINDAGSYSKTALMDVLGVSEEVAIQIQHSGKLPSKITDEQKKRLIGEALMANGGMTWDGISRGNKKNFSLAMSDYDMGQIVINPIKDASGKITGYDRFAINAELIRNPFSYYSIRKQDEKEDFQGLDFITFSKKDLNGNILDLFTTSDWQTVANGYTDSTMSTYAFTNETIWRDDTVAAGSDFNMRIASSNHYDGAKWVISDFTDLAGNYHGGSSSLPYRTLVHSDYNWDKNTMSYRLSSYGKISAACFVNSVEILNSIYERLNVYGYPSYPYNIKGHVTDKNLRGH